MILVPSRAGVADLDPDEEDKIKSEYKGIRETLPVNAKEGIGFEVLKEKLVKYALDNGKTIKKIPRIFNELDEMIGELAKDHFR